MKDPQQLRQSLARSEPSLRRELLHGYQLWTDFGADPAAGEERIALASTDGLELRFPELVVRRGDDRPVRSGVTPGEVCELLAEERQAMGRTFFLDQQGRLHLRFDGVAELIADDRLTRATAHLSPGLDPGLLPVIVHGNVMATRLVLDGHLALHASAVERDGRAIAFCGSSGMGKSTMAALGVASGHRLVTDDVLRVDLTVPPAQVWPGAEEVRLRRAALEIAGQLRQPGSLRTTADGRWALRDGNAARGPLALAYVVVPLPDRQARHVEVRRADPFSALGLLTAFPRLTGWCHRESLLTQFHLLADLCERVPVVQARLPWGPPFAPSLFPRLLDALDEM